MADIDIDSTAVERLRLMYTRELRSEWEQNSHLQGKMFRGKKGTAFGNHVPMSFSMTLLDLAGGIRELLSCWEEYE